MSTATDLGREKVTLRYRRRSGACCVGRIDRTELPARLASLAQQRIEAVAEDDGGPCGWSWKHEDAGWTWCADMGDGHAREAKP